MDYKLEVVVVPVADVDRAKQFYSEQLGFAVDVDHSPNERYRVVQLTPPGSACSVVIGKGFNSMPPGSIEGLQLVVDDIEAAQAELRARGVPIGPIQHHDGEGFQDGKGGPWNSFIFFSDPDGNSWAIQEKPAPDVADGAGA